MAFTMPYPMILRKAKETVRTELIRNLGHLPDVSLGSPVPDYAYIMGNSKFCLCPKGL